MKTSFRKIFEAKGNSPEAFETCGRFVVRAWWIFVVTAGRMITVGQPDTTNVVKRSAEVLKAIDELDVD